MRFNENVKTLEKLMQMSDKEYEAEIALYSHPMIIDGTRYLFKENPITYAKEMTEELYPNLVEERMMNIFYDKGIINGGKSPDMEECREEAKRSLTMKVIRNPEFKNMLIMNLEWMKDPKQFQEMDGSLEKEGDLER